nr:hypothetical protein [Tanacetum cinerariifolium]
DNESQKKEIDIVTNTDELLPSGFKNDDSKGEINVVEELHVDNSIQNSENELSNNEGSDFDNLSFPRPPPEPPDAKFEPDSGEEILVVMHDDDELKCLDPRDEFDLMMMITLLSCFLFILRCFLFYSPLRVRILFLTLVSPFRADGIPLGWNFHVLSCLS